MWLNNIITFERSEIEWMYVTYAYIDWYTLLLVIDTWYFWKQKKISYFAVQVLFNISFGNILDGSDSRCLTLLSLGRFITTMKRPVKQASISIYLNVSNLSGHFYDEMWIVSNAPFFWLRHGLPRIGKNTPKDRHHDVPTRCSPRLGSSWKQPLEVKGTAGEVTRVGSLRRQCVQHGRLVVGLGPGGLGVSYNLEPYILMKKTQEPETTLMTKWFTKNNLKKHQRNVQTLPVKTLNSGKHQVNWPYSMVIDMLYIYICVY